jgi:DNA-directed RNA polymerase specialized sigma24 family protein
LSNSPDTPDLNQLYLYTRVVVRRYLFRIRDIIPPELWKDEIDELTQVALFKFWEISQRKQIAHRHAYISRIVHSLVVDTARRYRATVGLPLDEYGEITKGKVIASLSDGMLDPASEIEHKEEKNACIEKVVRDIVSLPPCQRRAMICLLKDEVEEIQLYSGEFKKYGIAIDQVHLPNNRRAVQASRASLSVARKKMRSLQKSYTLADKAL